MTWNEPARGLATELMQGAIDLHTHSQPEVGLDIPKRFHDWEWAEAAKAMGMRAIVLKSHLWPTMVPACHLQHAVPDILVFGTITLNQSAGGVEPWAVEAAARLGGKMVFMPTWSAAHDIRLGSASKQFKGFYPSLESLTPEKGIRIVDSEGHLLPNAAQVLAVAHSKNLPVCTGHLSPEESIALGEEARRIGFPSLIFSHPHGPSVRASTEQIRRMVELGAYLELCFLSLMPVQRLDPKVIVQEIQEFGPERCVMTTDYFRQWCPSPPEMLRSFIGVLLEQGVGAEAIRTMVQVNPSKLLGLE